MAVVNLNCHIGRASNTFAIPANFSGTPEFIESAFNEGSRGVIRLVPDSCVDNAPLIASNPSLVDAVDLHRCLAKLTGNTPGGGSVKNIGLVLADRYKWKPSVLGLMFDRGFPTVDDPNDDRDFIGTAREGCAIFVGAIQAAREDPIEFVREIEFTTIHELGHVFNLAHRSGCFMETSPANRAHGNDRFKFHSGQKNWLEECDTNLRVKPGGSRFEPTMAFNEALAVSPHSSTVKFTLEIGVGTPEFPCSAPVELDVMLRSNVLGKRRWYIPDRLDPGYDEFKIWITRPDGERRLFRSPRHYCARPARIAISKEHPFHRDISLFESATGTVFGMPGLYSIQAQFDLGRRGVLVSNVITVEALPDKQLMSVERVSLMNDALVRRFLYHRSKKIGTEVIKRLEAHLKSQPSGIGANDIRYALVRMLTSETKRLTKRDRARVLNHLHAMQAREGTLGFRQLCHVERLIGKLNG